METSQVDHLLQKYFDSQLSPEEKRELEELLLSKPAARQEFWKAARIHGLIRLWGEAEWGRHAASQKATSDLGSQAAWWVRLMDSVRIPWQWGLRVAAVTVLTLAGVFAIQHFRTPSPLEGSGLATAGISASESNSLDHEAGVAVLKSVADAVWEDRSHEYQPGATLLPGWLRLRSGAVQLEFTRGARVLLEGPAELKLISADEAQLLRGRLRAHVSEPASGFKITSPMFNLVDRGTEFGCNVPAQGAPEVYVFRGMVELSSKKGAWANRSVKADQAVSISADSVDNIKANPAAFPNEEDVARAERFDFNKRFKNWQTQTERFASRSNLVLLYTFEHHETWERTLRNQALHAPPGTDATLIGCNWVQGRWPGKGGVEFSRNDDRIRTHVSGKFRSMTYLAWLRVDSLPNHYTSLAMTESLAVGEVHWSLDQRGNLLLSARKAPPTNPRDWEASVAYGAVKPEMTGSWICLASVYDADASTVTHYLNGKAVLTNAVSFPSTLELQDVEIGNWGVRAGDPRWSRLLKAGSADPIRAFKGRLDEFALLEAPLSADEIREIYDYGKPVAAAFETADATKSANTSTD